MSKWATNYWKLKILNTLYNCIQKDEILKDKLNRLYAWPPHWTLSNTEMERYTMYMYWEKQYRNNNFPHTDLKILKIPVKILSALFSPKEQYSTEREREKKKSWFKNAHRNAKPLSTWHTHECDNKIHQIDIVKKMGQFPYSFHMYVLFFLSQS